MIRIKDLAFSYPTGNFTLSIGALSITSNEKTAVIGPSGTGKTTLLNLIAGIATPADAALMMQLGVDGVFVGSGIFKSGNPAKRGAAIVKAVTHFNNPEILAEISRNLGEPMVGRNVVDLEEHERLSERGW